MDIAKSASFVEERGSALERARMRRILYGVEPEPEAVQSFAALQNDDGGFPFDMVKGYLSTISDTLVALWWMDDLEMLKSPLADKACRYLLALQRDDGGWDEDPAIARYDPPPWASPGDLRTRLYLSAESAYWLALAGYKHHPAFPKALDFLLRHRSETGKFYGFLHTTWIAAGVLAMAGSQYAEVMDRSLRCLLDKPLSEWVSSQIAWALDCLGRAGVPKDHPFVANGLAELLRRQGTDGSWASEDGEAHAVGATLQTVKVLKWYGLLR